MRIFLTDLAVDESLIVHQILPIALHLGHCFAVRQRQIREERVKHRLAFTVCPSRGRQAHRERTLVSPDCSSTASTSSSDGGSGGNG